MPDHLPKLLHFNFLGGILTFLFPFSVGLSLCGTKTSRAVFFLCSSLTGLCIIFIQSRSSLFGALFGVSIIALNKSRKILYCWLGAVLLYVIYIAVSGSALDAMLLTDTGVSRIKIWHRALKMIEDFPISGVGYLTFPFILDMFYPLELLNAQVPHPHNTYLDFACTLGLPGFVGFLVIIGCWMGQSLDMLRLSYLSESPEWRFISLGLIGGISGHLVYSMTDAMIVGRTVGIVFWTFLGMSTITWRLMHNEFLKRRKEPNGYVTE
jgi:O-antigen ligase